MKRKREKINWKSELEEESCEEQDKDQRIPITSSKSDNILNNTQIDNQKWCKCKLPFASPMAGEKLNQRIMKIVKHTAKHKFLRRGVKEVVKSIRKGKKGICILAGDVSPIDVISHLPVYCEENNIPYIFVASKAELGLAASTKRPTSCVLAQTLPPDKLPEKIEKKWNQIVSELAQIT
ncbi:MAG: putative Box H/ACA snoRNP component [Streblomastix strix]|uniref:H/ACA ribonucleoprotein complex subunit 2 n=1 Tax=Streblomastix strix TaxID=222440 RepID=A0A5J4X4M1_9EUKA|nr:MAG: putative Box H/ACA snoRNP component [Streblomastix strix]